MQHAPADVPLGDGDDQAQVGPGEVVAGPVAVALAAQEALALDLVQRPEGAGLLHGVDRLGGLEARSDPLGQRHLFVRRQQRNLADLLQVDPHRVGRDRRGVDLAIGATGSAGPTLGRRLGLGLLGLRIGVGRGGSAGSSPAMAASRSATVASASSSCAS